jgi:hypothetical protein
LKRLLKVRPDNSIVRRRRLAEDTVRTGAYLFQ